MQTLPGEAVFRLSTVIHRIHVRLSLSRNRRAALALEHAASSRQEDCHGFARRSSAQSVPGWNPLHHRGPRRRRGPSSHPFAISRISRRPSGGTTGRCGRSNAFASRPHGTTPIAAENNFARRNRASVGGVECLTPGGVPPSPQPLTHPAKDPGPSGAGVFFCFSVQTPRYPRLRCPEVQEFVAPARGCVPSSCAHPEFQRTRGAAPDNEIVIGCLETPTTRSSRCTISAAAGKSED